VVIYNFFGSHKDLYKYQKDENSNTLKNENGIELTQEIINGTWMVEWEYNKNIEPNMILLYPNDEIQVPISDNLKESITINEIIISPLSFAIDFKLNRDDCENTSIWDASFCINFKDGTHITDMDVPTNVLRSIELDSAIGHYYCKYDDIIDINEIESISIDDMIIPIN
ncbi:MAG: hypothetical protein Q4G33_06740, partial [bacterium]|nr:hypothetical protein [bacterium]